MTTPISGILGLMGSDEFEPWAEEAERQILSRAEGDGTVAILPLAAALEGPTFSAWAHKGLEHYHHLGVPARVVEFKNRADSSERSLVAELSDPTLSFSVARACQRVTASLACERGPRMHREGHSGPGRNPCPRRDKCGT